MQASFNLQASDKKQTAQPVSGGKASVEPLMALTAADMQAVNALILSKAGSDVEMIPQITRHLISSGGKRLRPMLTLAAAQMFGYSGKSHIILAASVEFMHTATLFHDDVVDESGLRRGHSTARMIWGNQASVLVGDYLLGQAFKMMVETRSLPALEVLSNAACVIAEGEVMQLAAARHLNTDKETYLKVIYAKTAALFAAAAETGAIIAEASADARRRMAAYGKNLGLAFQLADDALDYGGSAAELGKNIGDDFREGKITLPVILSYLRGDEAEKAFWRKAMENGEHDETALKQALALIAKHGALAETIKAARQYGEEARAALDGLAETEHKRALEQVVDFCIERVC